MRAFRAAVIQSSVVPDSLTNVKNAIKLVDTAAAEGAKLITLPECFNSLYGVKYFTEYAEEIPNGVTCKTLSELAKKHSIYLVGGTIPEIDNKKFYNTCTVWGPDGTCVAKYRKMHLFDIDIPNGINFKESDSLSAGSELSTFLMGDIRVGLGVCYDIRFEELARLYRNMGCDILIYPGAFNMTTGPIHWELLQRSRALDNQVYVFGASVARAAKGYIAWGHSQVTDPWGVIIAQADIGEEILYADINLEVVDQVRQQIPIFKQRRTDLYDTIRRIK